MRKSQLHIYINIIFFVFFTVSLYAQTPKFTKPILGTNTLCATNSFNELDVTIGFTHVAFDVNNEFKIVMSDAFGDFQNAVELATVVSDCSSGSAECYNEMFSFTSKVSVPATTTYGIGYQIKILSTSPAMESPASNTFVASYRDVSELFILNNQKNVVLCGGPVDVSVNKGNEYAYRWYRRFGGVDTVIPGETSNTLTISEVGVYYAVIEAGACTDSQSGNPPSTIIKVTETSSGLSVAIDGADMIKLCSGDSHVLKASPDDSSYEYKWFKNGVPISGLPAYSPTLNLGTDSSKYGVYYVQIGSGCTAKSQGVTVVANTGSSIDVDIVGEEVIRFLLPNETLNLVAETSASSPNYKWYKDGVKMSQTTKKINVNQEGIYYVKVENGSGACSGSKSKKINVLNVVGLDPIIEVNPEYENCVSVEATLVLKGINVVASDGNSYELVSSEFDKFDYQWFKGTLPISNALTKEFEISSLTENGDYFLKIVKATLVADSNLENIKLTKGGFSIESSLASNILPDEGTIDLSIDLIGGNVNDFSYTWFKDGVEIDTNVTTITVNEEGMYSVTYDAFGCQNKIEVNIFTDTKVIPNIISPFNADEFNDTWVIPMIYMSPNVEVVIYETSGKEVFKTSNYQNNWPDNNNIKNNMLFYYRIIKDKEIIKSGTISVLD